MDMTTTGLPLEYQGNYGTAGGDLDIADLINNPEANGICRVHVMIVPEDGPYLGLDELQALR